MTSFTQITHILKIKSAQKGFTLFEMVIALVMVGVIAAFTLPTFIVSVNNDTLNNKVKSQIQQLQLAVIRYKQDNPILTAATSDQVVSQMKYVAKVTSGTLITGGSACAATVPCYRFADNSVIQASTVSPGTQNINGIDIQDDFVYFNVDPDGVDGSAAITIMYDFQKDRITTRQNATNSSIAGNDIAISPPAGLTVFTVNPSYYK